MSEFWSATAWVLSVVTLYCAGWAIIAANEAKLELAKTLSLMDLITGALETAGATAHRADARGKAAHERAAEAFSAAQEAKIEVEAMKRSTHTIQMVPVDDVADKSLNKGLDGVDDVAFQGLGDIDDAAGPLG